MTAGIHRGGVEIGRAVGWRWAVTPHNKERQSDEVRAEDSEQGSYSCFYLFKKGGAFQNRNPGMKDGQYFLQKHVDCGGKKPMFALSFISFSHFLLTCCKML